MSVRSMVVPLDELHAKVTALAEPGTNILDWFFANEVPQGWKLLTSTSLVQSSRPSLMNPNQQGATPVFYFFFEAPEVAA